MTIASRFFGRTMKLPPASNHDVQVERDLRVPMADGVQLLADRYVPPGTGGRRWCWSARRTGGAGSGGSCSAGCWPSAASRCWSRAAGERSAPAAPSTRSGPTSTTTAWPRSPGCANSPGTRACFATTGPSYLGMVQWAIAADAGPDLKAMCPQVTTSDFRAPFYGGEAFSLQTALTWVNQVAGQERRFAFVRQSRDEHRLQPLIRTGCRCAISTGWPPAVTSLTTRTGWPTTIPGTTTGRAAGSPTPWTGWPPRSAWSAAGTTSSCRSSCVTTPRCAAPGTSRT